MEPIFMAILFFGGIFAGLYASSVGGGSFVMFPLMILSGLPVHIAIASNRFGAVLLELSSTLRFYKEKKLDLKLGSALGIAAAIGSAIGSYIVLSINEKHLNLIVGIVFILIFLFVLNKNKVGLKEVKKNMSLYLTAVFTFALGIYGGFFGAGFGTFIMFLLVLGGFTFIKSAAIARVVGFIMSLVATTVFALNGVIDYTAGISAGIGLAIGAWIGVGIAIDKGNKYIKTLFIIIILATTAKLILEYFNVTLL